MTDEILLWKKQKDNVIPRGVSNIPEILEYGIQLSQKDKKQLTQACNSGSYEMASIYIWTKAQNALYSQLEHMGVQFIAEMLDRPDIGESESIRESVSSLDAINLSEELGIVTGTGAFRLRTALGYVSHFASMKEDVGPEDEMREDEAKSVILGCIENILGQSKIEAAIDFRKFRNALENETLDQGNSFVQKLLQSPYFFVRATMRILLSLVKTSVGAQLENSLANSNLIIPLIWGQLLQPERWQVGRSYAELSTDGQTKAASGLRKVLLKVKGFDFVPEDFRSNAFVKAAADIVNTHESIDNYHYEYGKIEILAKMGSIIPIPAFPKCMTAILCVRLGNYFGHARSAQNTASGLLGKISADRWIYYFEECLPQDQRILAKLMESKPKSRWMDLIQSLEVDYSTILNKTVKSLLKASANRSSTQISKFATLLYRELGYYSD